MFFAIKGVAMVKVRKMGKTRKNRKTFFRKHFLSIK